MSAPAAFRLGDGAAVTPEAAHAIWTAVAREVLEATAATATMTPDELARLVQQTSGVYTRVPATQWLPAVLVDMDAALTARVRAEAPRASARTKTTSPRRPRAEPAPRKRTEAPPAICPSCFMQLPASGRCDTCG
jgi:hypothetical protein